MGDTFRIPVWLKVQAGGRIQIPIATLREKDIQEGDMVLLEEVEILRLRVK